MLQTNEIDDIVPPNTTQEERTGIVSVVLVLIDEFEKKQRLGLIKYANLRKSRQGEQEPHIWDVNKIVGWAIWSLRLNKIRKIRSYTDDEESERAIQLRKEINFL